MHYGAPVAWGWHQTPGPDSAAAVGSMVMDKLVTANELYVPPLSAQRRCPAGRVELRGVQAGPTWQTTFADVLSFITDKIDVRLVRPEFVGDWCPMLAQLKPTLSGFPAVKLDAIGWIEATAKCVLRALPKAVAAGHLDNMTAQQLKHVASALSGVATVMDAHAGSPRSPTGGSGCARTCKQTRRSRSAASRAQATVGRAAPVVLGGSGGSANGAGKTLERVLGAAPATTAATVVGSSTSTNCPTRRLEKPGVPGPARR